MWLLHARTLELHEFIDVDQVQDKYAVLSHRWGPDEASFRDVRKGRGPERQAWSKIQGCCARALEAGVDYVWVDTCCIDKSSSAELSEAINSMFRWYQSARVCFAYLADVPALRQGGSIADGDRDWARVARSEWFRRGWTLQEFLAPRLVWFYDGGWEYLGEKRDVSYHNILQEATGISSQYFQDFREASVAQRMSWVSRRSTVSRFFFFLLLCRASLATGMALVQQG